MVEGFSISSDVDRKNKLKLKNRCICIDGVEWSAAISDVSSHRSRVEDGVGDKD